MKTRLGQMLEWYLLTRGISVREFGDQVGIHNTTIYRIINGESLPNSKATLRIMNWMIEVEEDGER